ncbi:MAG: branched-chain amino acid transport system substrate-binding protein [Alteromonadaceae bacterium]|jgi:branched-chain amino acid transport system substrate-binding protein
MKQDRFLFKQALESLKHPVQGLIKEYNQPFSSWREQQDDAHEALRLENFCMAKFGTHNQINVTVN